ncbi:unnamed protein product [Protopolystoma xenopodis]|uniref:Uncharacterized protein n=1 Tax=Protopolystoma xenopodis TaxID=117903 RepID=A0A3S5B9H3_9PLAT|nr:unnamed protein product [Protopolystoma xenopodis]
MTLFPPFFGPFCSFRSNLLWTRRRFSQTTDNSANLHFSDTSRLVPPTPDLPTSESPRRLSQSGKAGPGGVEMGPARTGRQETDEDREQAETDDIIDGRGNDDRMRRAEADVIREKKTLLSAKERWHYAFTRVCSRLNEVTIISFIAFS